MMMILKPQDILVVLKLVAIGDRSWSYMQLANELCMSASEINAGVKRALRARLLVQFSEGVQPQPNRKALEEFLLHGIKYAFPPDHGTIIRGMKTSCAAAPMVNELVYNQQNPPVWPYVEGSDRGPSLSPLYKSAPRAAEQDSALYELLVLVDAIRDGGARERNIAEKLLCERLYP